MRHPMVQAKNFCDPPLRPALTPPKIPGGPEATAMSESALRALSDVTQQPRVAPPKILTPPLKSGLWPPGRPPAGGRLRRQPPHLLRHAAPFDLSRPAAKSEPKNPPTPENPHFGPPKPPLKAAGRKKHPLLAVFRAAEPVGLARPTPPPRPTHSRKPLSPYRLETSLLPPLRSGQAREDTGSPMVACGHIRLFWLGAGSPSGGLRPHWTVLAKSRVAIRWPAATMSSPG